MSSKVLGQLLAVEDVLFSMEAQLPCHRQTLFVRKLDESLTVHLRQFSLNGYCLLLDPNRLVALAKKISWGSRLTLREKKNVEKRCHDISTETRPRVLKTLKLLLENSEPSSVFGTCILGHTIHFLRSPHRFKHALGLSDAVDLTMTTLDMRVKMPGKISIPAKGKNYSFRKRLHSSSWNKKWFIVLNRMTTDHRRYHLLIHYLREFPKDLIEKDYVKLIKLSLTGLNSEKLEQELPSGYPDQAIKIFPPKTQRLLDRYFETKFEKKCQFYHSLLQSKSICAPVGHDMIEEAYEKHKASLCRDPQECTPCIMEEFQNLFEYGKTVGKRVWKYYEPYKTSLPNQRASIEMPRKGGGNLESLSQKEGRLKRYSNHPITCLDPENVRLEPYVIGLFGSPASGKTTLVQQLVRRVSQLFFPNLKRTDCVYARSCSTKHWDGYHGQPIVILDDFGQDLSDRSDVKEFEQLISVNDYVLPMADLPEKGVKFNSPIVILTSNCQYGGSLNDGANARVVEEPWAVWRRIDLPLRISRSHQTVIERILCGPSKQQVEVWQNKHGLERDRISSCRTYPGFIGSDKPAFTRLNYHTLIEMIVKGVNGKFDYHSRVLSGTWMQSISCQTLSFGKPEGMFWDPHVTPCDFPLSARDHSLSLEFPDSPPLDPPVVKAHAIAEPLKVRMITVAESDTKVLQPFQKALWKDMGDQPQFCLTNGVKTLEDFEDDTLPWIYRIEECINRIKDATDSRDLWLSGDYTAATDNFPMWVTEALIEGILSEIPHEPTKSWARWECSPHKILYPGSTSGTQTSGQLMGSLLSFPLLCYLNDYIVSSSGFRSGTYLVNGDDVVARGPKKAIETWKSRCPKVGLTLSLGKNHIHPRYCTVNSQLFVDGKVLHTGKVSCQTRLGTTLGYCFAEAQFYYGPSDRITWEFIRRNVLELRKSPRSLFLPRHLGGLGLYDTTSSTNRFDSRLAKRVYFCSLLKKMMCVERLSKDGSIPFSAVAVPVWRGSYAKEKEGPIESEVLFERLRSLEPRPEVSEAFDDLSHKSLYEFEKRLQEDLTPKAKEMYNHILSSSQFDVREFPPLKDMELKYVFVTNPKARFIRNLSLEYALGTFMGCCADDSYESAFTYEGGDISEMSEVQEEIDFFNEDFTQAGIPWFFGEKQTSEQAAVLEWFEGRDTLGTEDQFGLKKFLPLPHDTTPIIDFLQCFSNAEVSEQNNDLLDRDPDEK